jgi:hypothetical protein
MESVWVGGDVERVQRMRWGGFFGKEVASEMDQSYERSPGIGGTCATVFCPSCAVHRWRHMFAFIVPGAEMQKKCSIRACLHVLLLRSMERYGGVHMTLARLGIVSAATLIRTAQPNNITTGNTLVEVGL